MSKAIQSIKIEPVVGGLAPHLLRHEVVVTYKNGEENKFGPYRHLAVAKGALSRIRRRFKVA